MLRFGSVGSLSRWRCSCSLPPPRLLLPLQSYVAQGAEAGRQQAHQNTVASTSTVWLSQWTLSRPARSASGKKGSMKLLAKVSDFVLQHPLAVKATLLTVRLGVPALAAGGVQARARTLRDGDVDHVLEGLLWCGGKGQREG